MHDEISGLFLKPTTFASSQVLFFNFQLQGRRGALGEVAVWAEGTFTILFRFSQLEKMVMPFSAAL